MIDLQGFQESPNTATVISPALTQAMTEQPMWLSAPPNIMTPECLRVFEAQILLEVQTELPYHNLGHAKDVARRTLLLFGMAGFTEYETQLGHIAALAHDFKHSGRVFRQLGKSCEYPELSNEEYAVLKVDEHLHELLGVRERLVIQGLVLSTSFGQSDIARLPKASATALHRDYRPVTDAEKLLVLADVGHFMEGWPLHYKDSIRMAREMAAGSPDGVGPSYEEWLSSHLKFLQYVKGRLLAVSHLFDTSDLALTLNDIRGRVEDMQHAGQSDAKRYRKEYQRSLSAA